MSSMANFLLTSCIVLLVAGAPLWNTILGKLFLFGGMVFGVSGVVKAFKDRKATKANLELRIDTSLPYLYKHGNYTYYRLGVQNNGPAVANNVRVWLRDIAPRPKSTYFRADFPYQVARMAGPEGRSLDSKGCFINPNSEELFEIGKSWISGDNRLMLGGIDTKLSKNSPLDAIQMDKDECWDLKIEVEASNADGQTTRFAMKAEGNEIIVST